MPDSPWGRVLGAGYLLTVVASALVWVIQGAHSAALITMALTLPFSPVAYVVVHSVAAVGVGIGIGQDGHPLARIALAAVVLVLFSGLAIADVAMTRAAWHAHRRRRLRSAPAPTS